MNQFLPSPWVSHYPIVENNIAWLFHNYQCPPMRGSGRRCREKKWRRREMIGVWKRPIDEEIKRGPRQRSSLGKLQPMSCHTVQCKWKAGPCLPCVSSFMSVFCVHLRVVIYQQHQWQQLGLPKLTAERLLASAGGTVRRGSWYGPPIIVQIIAPPPLSSS